MGLRGATCSGASWHSSTAPPGSTCPSSAARLAASASAGVGARAGAAAGDGVRAEDSSPTPAPLGPSASGAGRDEMAHMTGRTGKVMSSIQAVVPSMSCRHPANMRPVEMGCGGPAPATAGAALALPSLGTSAGPRRPSAAITAIAARISGGERLNRGTCTGSAALL